MGGKIEGFESLVDGVTAHCLQGLSLDQLTCSPQGGTPSPNPSSNLTPDPSTPQPRDEGAQGRPCWSENRI